MQLSFDFCYEQPFLDLGHLELEQFQNWLLETLKSHELEITFRKTSGEIRVMRATLVPELLPVTENTEKPKRAQVTTACSVFDVEAQDWRSFRWDSIIRVCIS
jgi:hypothetical protein